MVRRYQECKEPADPLAVQLLSLQFGGGLVAWDLPSCAPGAEARGVAVCSLHLFLDLQEFADSLGIPFLETSAKNATNVEQSFMTMAAEIKKRMGPGATAGGAEKSNVKIQSTPVKQSSGGCC